MKHNQLKQTLLYNLIKNADQDPTINLTLNPVTLLPPTTALPRRVGRPKQNWTTYTLPLLWTTLHQVASPTEEAASIPTFNQQRQRDRDTLRNLIEQHSLPFETEVTCVTKMRRVAR